MKNMFKIIMVFLAMALALFVRISIDASIIKCIWWLLAFLPINIFPMSWLMAYVIATVIMLVMTLLMGDCSCKFKVGN